MLVEDRTYADAFLVPGKRERNESSRAALREAFKRLRRSGVKDLYYLPGAELLGDDGDATVDSSHPNDLGFRRQADAEARVLGPILRRLVRATPSSRTAAARPVNADPAMLKQISVGMTFEDISRIVPIAMAPYYRSGAGVTYSVALDDGSQVVLRFSQPEDGQSISGSKLNMPPQITR